jgi:hypothetical protein
MVKLNSTRSINRVISRLPEVNRALQLEAKSRAKIAEAIRAMHERTGNLSVKVEHGRVDWYIVLDDPAAFSIEFGHMNKRTGKYVEGLHILSKATGLM